MLFRSGSMDGGTTAIDVHGAGSQRSDPKDGDASDYPAYVGPQGDVRRVFNYVRLVRDADTTSVQPDPDPVPESDETIMIPIIVGDGQSDGVSSSHKIRMGWGKGAGGRCAVAKVPQDSGCVQPTGVGESPGIGHRLTHKDNLVDPGVPDRSHISHRDV